MTNKNYYDDHDDDNDDYYCDDDNNYNDDLDNELDEALESIERQCKEGGLSGKETLGIHLLYWRAAKAGYLKISFCSPR